MKKWYDSWTVWVNVVTFAGLLLALFGSPEYAGLFSAEFLKVGGLVVAGANIFIRVFRTNEQIQL